MEDAFGHLISYLRVSVTDRCNERCVYCMPDEGQDWLPREDILSYEEIHRVCRVATGLGVKKLRITGGEPLTRKGVTALLASLCSLDGIDEVGVSSNGTLLARKDPDSPTGATFAESLAEAGVSSVNVSLDSLDATRYRLATGRDFLDRAIDGIRAARAQGMRVKINSVLMKNRSEAELGALLDFAREEDALLRFIELMPVTDADVLEEDRFLASGLARRILELRTGKMKARPDFRTNGPASYYEVPETGQLVGFISALSDLHFCDTCNKLRLTSEGKLRPCLGSHLEFDLREQLRDPKGCTDEQIVAFFREVVGRKPETHGFRDDYEPGRNMIAIGG